MAGAITGGELLKDRYRLEHTLGHGGMAAVWLGHDELLDRPVAVKVISEAIASDPSFLARFRREAHTVAGLSHRNLVRVYDFSDEEERPYTIMEFVPGEDLASVLRRRRPVDAERLARELLDALVHIHAVGILHRDIKPGNVLVEPDGTAKLIDFGIALPPDATALTQTGLVLGTERFSAPEVKEGRPATERSDLYSCGVLLESCGATDSPALRATIAAMTAKDPRARPLSAAQALAEIDADNLPPGEQTVAFEPTHAFAPRGTVGATPVFEPTVARSRRTGRFRTVVVALGVLVALIVGGILALGGGGDKPAAGAGRAAQAEGGAGRAGAGGKTGAKNRSNRKSGSPAATTSSNEAAAGSTSASTQTAKSSGSPDPERGAELNEEGFAMLQAGDYASAVPVLEEAVASFPQGTDDLSYAYALFNLGEALRFDGHASEAIPILERRLQIPDQEDEVRKALDAAYAEAGGPASSGAGE